MAHAVVLLSGGLDSVTCLALAQADAHSITAVSFDYGQRHNAELHAARHICQKMGITDHRVIRIDLGQLGGSALTDSSIAVPEVESAGIPVTYVPARNTVFLSYALALAEVTKANAIYIGVNAIDYSGYPDCRPDFIQAFEVVANLATRAGVEGNGMEIRTPLIAMSKADIIQTGMRLGVDYALTTSCYQANELGEACGRCDACRLRKKGFEQAGVDDPTRYFI
ncbi:MAG: 7-cyano-7-deazaguanine synthase QueC [Moraxellaceae bacterium]|nr:7-cyano-7-deazaguanine synthase QueC [Moraxellaceae bacterium]MDZ4387083.1 7-cyano-7-deazaguanine synthase QueC [Moraxellaceae bacterium]